jgi:arylsulfatase A-like enzyme
MKPNMIFLMCDDLGYGDTGFNGHPRIRTPHLDALRMEGMKFTRFYAGGPVCSPTRGTCLTGRHYSRYGITHANVGHLPEEEITIAQVTKEQGYTTGHFGKWHLGTLDRDYSGKNNRDAAVHYAPPWDRDYDDSFSTEFAVPTWDPGRGYDMQTFERDDDPWGSPYYDNGKRVEEMLTGCDSERIVDRAVPFIEQAVARKQPFMTTIWFHAPHTPLEAGSEFLEMYKDCDPEEAHYYGVVTAMDRQVGRIHQLIKDLGVEETTMIWFCSDNGPEGREEVMRPSFRRCRGQTDGLRGRKRSLYNGGVGVPALVKWPGVVEPGSECTVPCSTLDYFPTVLGALEVSMPDDRPLDGIDITPILTGVLTERPTPIPYRFMEKERAMFGSPTLALTDNKWKFLTHLSDTGEEDQLYNVLEDRGETRNILSDHPQVAASMKATLVTFMDSCRRSHTGADYPTPYEPVMDFQELTGTWWE